MVPSTRLTLRRLMRRRLSTCYLSAFYSGEKSLCFSVSDEQARTLASRLLEMAESAQRIDLTLHKHTKPPRLTITTTLADVKEGVAVTERLK